MKKESKKIKINFSTLLLFIILIIFITTGLVIYKIQNKNNSNTITTGKANEVSNVLNTTKTNSTTENSEKPTLEDETIAFITSDSAISTSDTVGAYIPEHYYFKTDKNFTYTAVPYYKAEGDIISYSGTWDIKDDILILNITEECKTQGGVVKQAEASEPYDHLVGYTEVTSNVNYKKEYKILEFVIDENNNEYVKLEGMNLYKIGI